MGYKVLGWLVIVTLAVSCGGDADKTFTPPPVQQNDVVDDGGMDDDDKHDDDDLPLQRTIYAIQDGSTPVDTRVEVNGIWVTATTAVGFYAQEKAGGEYAGIRVYTGEFGPDISTLSMGDVVDVQGVVKTVNEVRMIDASAGTVIDGAAYATPDPDTLALSAITAEVAAPWTSVFVRVEEWVTVVALPDSGEFLIHDGVTRGRVGHVLYNAVADGAQDFPGLTTGSAFTAVQGLVAVSAGAYAIAPRSSTDLEGYVASRCTPALDATIRDFKIVHDDFESTIGVDPGIVKADLGPDNKPVYDGNPTTLTTTGEDHFNEWYNDVADVNLSFPLEIALTEISPGTFDYADNAFFPIDDQGWGNEGNAHNYHFTTEMHTRFVYEGGEVFTFEGDDDVFVFVNGKLGMDLGGVHGPLQGSIDLDAQAENLGLEIGGIYDLAFFHAQRHTTASNFRITTTTSCFLPPVAGP